MQPDLDFTQQQHNRRIEKVTDDMFNEFIFSVEWITQRSEKFVEGNPSENVDEPFWLRGMQWNGEMSGLSQFQFWKCELNTEMRSVLRHFFGFNMALFNYNIHLKTIKSIWQRFVAIQVHSNS